MQSGIENLFDSEIVETKDEEYIFDITTIDRNGVIQSRNRKLRKINFEKFILEERQNESDFYRFEELFNLIREKINNKV
jgi:tRNA splicing endonuclease